MAVTRPECMLSPSFSSNLVPNDGKFFKPPNPDDIKDFVNQMEGAMRSENISRPPSELCDHARTLLRNFDHFSRSLVRLLEMSLDPQYYSSAKHSNYLKELVHSLHSEIESIPGSISNVKKQYSDFGSQLRHPKTSGGNKGYQIFDRLEAFWKITATQLSRMLDPDARLPSREDIQDARQEWVNYRDCLESSMYDLDEHYVCLMATRPKELKGRSPKGEEPRTTRVKKGHFEGLIVFWTRLTRRSSIRE